MSRGQADTAFPRQIHRAEDKLHSKIQQLDIGNRDHDVATQHDAFVEDPIQDLAQRDTLVFLVMRVVREGLTVQRSAGRNQWLTVGAQL